MYLSAKYPAAKLPITAPTETNEPIQEFSSGVIFLPRGLSSTLSCSLGNIGLVHPNKAPAATQHKFAEIITFVAINLFVRLVQRHLREKTTRHIRKRYRRLVSLVSRDPRSLQVYIFRVRDSHG